jgi:3-hydroxyisobutyrate dehydrogenase-like beta-hydroxyacid dehydrogenase
MYKDFGLILQEAAEQSVAMPATASARQMYAAEMAKGIEEDYSAVIRLMESLACVPRAERTIVD